MDQETGNEMIPTAASEETIFCTARQIQDPGEREQYLRQACRGNEARQRRIRRLLEAEYRADQFLAGDPLNQAPDSALLPAGGADAEGLGTTIGRYKLLQKIGEGGMGLVYMAEQQEPVRRRVALKLIKLGMDTNQVVARFEAERQALALMDHPHIAKVLDGGATTTGRPYFVMELVEGIAITEFCRKNQSSSKDRLTLFVQVCRAVQHAHQKGVIHRDLKPSNILVTFNEGIAHPMVIDFGVAKALNRELTEKTLFTRFATLVGTPAYMSPEQAQMSKMDVDTRSDVYSLGVLLYELLTGTQPFPEQRLRSVGYGEMQRIIAEEEPERPSTRLGQALRSSRTCGVHSRNERIDPDLDWIVMKCLEKDRNRRYATANGLATDVQRHLAQEPVVARPPSVSYRFGKWARRNTVTFVAASTVAAILVSAVVVSSWLAMKAKEASTAAREQAAKALQAEHEAKSVKDFLLEQLIGTANPFKESEPDPNKRPLLERIARQLEGRFADQPLIEAQLRSALGDAFRDLSEYSRAASEWERCLAIRRRILTLENSETLQALAAVADAYTQSSRRAEAEQLLKEGLAVLKDSPLRQSLGGGLVLQAQGSLLFRNRNNAAALPYFQESLAVLQQCPDHTFDQVMSTIQAIGYTTHLIGQKEEAHKLIADAVQQCERERGGETAATAALLHTQAELLLGDGKWAQALPVLERYVPLNRRIFGTNSNEAVQDDFFVGRAYELKGDVEEAVKRYAPLPARYASFFLADNPRSQCREIAQFFVKQRRYDLARSAYLLLGNWYKSHPPEWSWEFDLFLESVTRAEGWPAAAAIVRANLDRQPESPDVWAQKALTARCGHDEELYRQVIRKLLQLNPPLSTSNFPHASIELAALGPIAFSDSERQQLDALISGLESLAPGLDHHVQGWSYAAIGHLQLRLGRFDASRKALDHAQQVLAGETGPHVFYCRAICLHRLGQAGAAQTAFGEGDAALIKELPGPLESIPQFERFLSPWTLCHGVLLRQEAAAELSDVPRE